MTTADIEALAKATPGFFSADKNWLHTFAAALRAEVLEEAARLVEGKYAAERNHGVEPIAAEKSISRECAAAIRALKSTP